MVGTNANDIQGLQLINVADPLNPTAGGAVQRQQDDDFDLIDHISDVSAIQIDGHHYALVASSTVGRSDGGALVIVNITKPNSLSHVWSQSAGNSPLDGYYHVNELFPVYIGGHPYAVVSVSTAASLTSSSSDSILILNMTDPKKPTRASDMPHPSDKLAVTKVGGHHYVLAGQYSGQGLTIFNITDPSAPYSVANVTEGQDRSYQEFNSITAVEVGGIHYAVATTVDQTIVVTDITDPANPFLVSNISTKTFKDPPGSSLRIPDGTVNILGRHYVPAIGDRGGFFTMLDITDPTQITEGRGGDPPTFDVLDYPTDVTTIKIRDIPYALVTARDDDGLQIINMSDPSSPIPVKGVRDGPKFKTLNSAWHVDAAKIGDGYYALVTSLRDSGIQIINITDPANPSPTASVTRNTPGFGGVDDFQNIVVTKIKGQHYALVDDTDRNVHIINIADPASPRHVSNATNGQDGFVIDGIYDIAATEIKGRHYVLVPSFNSESASLQMIDVTVPADPVAAGLARWGDDDFTPFGNPYVAVATEINGRHYALVTSASQSSLQIIDITNPYSLSAVTTFKTSSLHDYSGVEVMESGGHHYALVSIRSYLTVPDIEQLLVINITDPSVPSLVKTVSSGGTSDFAEFNTVLWMQVMQAASRDYVLMPGTGLNRLSVVDLTDPLNPSNPLLPHLRLDLGEGGDGYATYDRQENGGRTLVFQYVTGLGDHTPDLSYDGQDALQMGRTILLNADGTLLPQVVLPEPGAPDSLSDSKQISIYGTDTREHFVTTWEVHSAGDSITLPASQASGTYTVYWGDGQAEYDISGDATHVYEEAGNYTVSTQGLDRIRLGADAASAAMLSSIDSWGTTRWTSMSEAFRGASSMTHAADDVPDLSEVRSMAQMFRDSSVSDGLSGWSVSSVEKMSSVFRGAAVFDGNVSGWDVSSARDVSSMFRDASSFNQDISGWSTSSVEDTSYMFQDASSFNQDVSGWDVSSVKDMTSMFDGASSFAQNLGRWYVTVEDTSINGAEVPGIVGTISAQNVFLDGQDPLYGIMAEGPDSERFAVFDDDQLFMVSLDGNKTEYVAKIMASGPQVFGDGNNWVDVRVSVPGGAPSTSLTVDAGGPQSANEGDTVMLSGNATGAPPQSSLTYQWAQISPGNLQAVLVDVTAPVTTFDAPQVESDTIFTFILNATDGTDSASDLTRVTVLDVTTGPAPLTVHAESLVAAREGDSVTLSGSIAGATQGSVTYRWVQTSPASPQASLGDAAAKIVIFDAPSVESDTTFTFTLNATDGAALPLTWQGSQSLMPQQIRACSQSTQRPTTQHTRAARYHFQAASQAHRRTL